MRDMKMLVTAAKKGWYVGEAAEILHPVWIESTLIRLERDER